MVSTLSSQNWNPPRIVNWVNLGLRGVDRFKPVAPFHENEIKVAALKKAFGQNADLKLIKTLESPAGEQIFWGTRYQAPLQALIKAYGDDKRLTPIGRVICRSGLIHHLSNRARLQADFTAQPELAQQQIRRPLFVIGMPRSGTTLLFNLLAQDPAARPLLFWESMSPSAPKAISPGQEDPRMREADKTINGLNKLAPNLKSIHEFNPRGPEECLGLLCNALLTPFFRGAIPEYREWLDQLSEAEVDAGYQEYVDQLKVLQAQRAGEHWLLKCPSHLFGLSSLLKLFPDVAIVQTHRELTKTVPSLCSLSATLDTLIYPQADLKAVGSRVYGVVQQLIQRCLIARQDRTEERVLDIHYRDLVSDPLATVGKIYAHFGLNLSQAMREKMQQYLSENKKHKHGAHSYSLEQFHLSASQLNQEFHEYNQRFEIETP